MGTLIITDNAVALEIARELQGLYRESDIAQSPGGDLENVIHLNVKRDSILIADTYSLVLSIHCKQIFPKELISKIRCVNVHPGFNPYNRGWFPHVFSMLNGLKAGVTIHEMDEELDHGSIIVQREYKIKSWDTSESAYRNILAMERELLLEYFEIIRKGAYKSFQPTKEGNLNYQKDYEKLKLLDLDRIGSFKSFLDLLRALSHGSYRNAYFIDGDGNRIYVRVTLEKEDVK